jgi:toxin ParE2
MYLTYIEEARQELLEAVAWYEECQPGLGRQFDAEIQRAEDAILLPPNAWSNAGGGFRRKLLHRFPYTVAIMHQHRQPDYWHRRQR